jgi:hypothetical protein
MVSNVIKNSRHPLQERQRTEKKRVALERQNLIKLAQVQDSTTIKTIVTFYPINMRQTVLHCKISGFHGSDYEEWHLLGCYAVWLF